MVSAHSETLASSRKMLVLLAMQERAYRVWQVAAALVAVFTSGSERLSERSHVVAPGDVLFVCSLSSTGTTANDLFVAR